MDMLCLLSLVSRGNLINGLRWIRGIGKYYFITDQKKSDCLNASWGCAWPQGDYDKNVRKSHLLFSLT